MSAAQISEFEKELEMHVFSVIACLSVAFALQAGIGIKDCSIYVANGNPPSVKLAAQELQKHVELCTGIRLPITAKPAKPMIALGSSPEAKAAGVDASKLEQETHIIRTVGDNLFIAGRDLPNDAYTGTGGKSYGTLYGTYAFLNETMGVAWPYPTDKGIYAPKLGKDWQIPALDKTFQPPFALRGFQYIPRDSEAFLEWKRRNYNYEGMSWFAGRKHIPVTHSWWDIYPQTGSPLAKVNKDAMSTFKEHPEYFNAMFNGERVAPQHNFALCLTNPEAVRDAAARYVNLLRFSKTKQPFPDYIISLSPNDASRCFCKKCLAACRIYSEKDVGPVKTQELGYAHNSCMSQLMLDYYRTVTESLAKEFRNLEASGLIYHQYEFPLDIRHEKMPPQFNAVIAPYHTSYGPGRIYEPVNRTWHSLMDGWDGIFEHRCYYGLDFWFNQAVGAPWPPFTALMKDTFRTLYDKKFDGILLYGGWDAASYPTNYLIMRLAWNPKLDPDTLLKEFCDKAYGKAGEPVMKIYRLSEKNMIEYMTSIQSKMGYYMTPELMKNVWGRDWNRFRELFLQAKSAEKDENQEWRFQLFRLNMCLLDYHLVKLGFIEENTNSPLHLSDKEYSILFNARLEKEGPYMGYLPMASPARYRYIRVALPLTKTETVPLGKKSSPVWIYGGATAILVKAVADKVEMKVEFMTEMDAKSKQRYLDPIGYFTVVEPGNRFHFAGIINRGTLSFPAENGKCYYVCMHTQTDWFARARMNIVSSNSPYAFETRFDPSGLNVAQNPVGTKFWFHVPEKLASFSVFARAWGGLAVLDPDGKELKRKDKIGGYYQFKLKVENGFLKSGWYALVTTVPYMGGHILLSRELDGFLITDPGHALFAEVNREEDAKRVSELY